MRSLTAYETSKCRLASRCRFAPMSNEVGEAGPSDALTVSWMNRSVRCVADRAAQVPLEAAGGRAAHAGDERRVGRRAAHLGREGRPGKSSWNEKQFGSSRTCCRAAGSGTSSVTATVGQSAEPRPSAARTSAISSVRPSVDAEHAEARVGVAEEEALRDLLGCVVRVGVELDAGQRVAEVAEGLEVVVDVRVAPALRALGADVGVAGRDERYGIAP